MQEFFKTYELISDNVTHKTYKVQFLKVTMKMNLAIDDNLKIAGLSFHEFTETQNQKAKRFDATNGIPNDVANIIIENCNQYPNGTQLSIATYIHGEKNYYGILIQNDTLYSTDNFNKHFEIGSITKTFTSLVLANLVINKRIKLNDTINQYYPFKFKRNYILQFEHLANHTSGLPRLPSNLKITSQNPYKKYDSNKLEQYLNDDLIINKDQIGEVYYSNLGTGLLGHTLSKVTEKSLPELFNEYVFSKYHMNSATTNFQSVKDNIVPGFDHKGNITSNWEMNALMGAGGIFSTTSDMMQFALAQMDTTDKAIQLTHQPTSIIDEQRSIGLGWFILKNEKNEPILWHNGGTAGYTSSISINTVQQKAVIILSNVSAFHKESSKIDEICLKIMKSN